MKTSNRHSKPKYMVCPVCEGEGRTHPSRKEAPYMDDHITSDHACELCEHYARCCQLGRCLEFDVLFEVHEYPPKPIKLGELDEDDQS